MGVHHRQRPEQTVSFDLAGSDRPLLMQQNQRDEKKVDSLTFPVKHIQLTEMVLLCCTAAIPDTDSPHIVQLMIHASCTGSIEKTLSLCPTRHAWRLHPVPKTNLVSFSPPHTLMCTYVCLIYHESTERQKAQNQLMFIRAVGALLGQLDGRCCINLNEHK